MGMFLQGENEVRNFMWVGKDQEMEVTILTSVEDGAPLLDYHKLTEPGNASFVLGPNKQIQKQNKDNNWKLNLKQGNVLTVLVHYTIEDDDGNSTQHSKKEVRLGNKWDAEFIQKIIDEHDDIRGARVKLTRPEGVTTSGSFTEFIEMTDVEDEAHSIDFIKENYFVKNEDEIQRLIDIQLA